MRRGADQVFEIPGGDAGLVLALAAAVGLVATLSFLLISAPVISQRVPVGHSPAYRGDSRCGPANMAMIARGFHRRPRLSDAALIETLDRLDDGLENHATTPAGI